jgi:hypothetical protein
MATHPEGDVPCRDLESPYGFTNDSERRYPKPKTVKLVVAKKREKDRSMKSPQVWNRVTQEKTRNRKARSRRANRLATSKEGADTTS